jgi:hypothetical protein
MTMHILERAILHIFSAASVYLLAFFALAWAMRRNAERTMQILPGLVGALAIALREPFDVANGQPVLKVITDYLSWLVGMTLAIWALTRYRKDAR